MPLYITWVFVQGLGSSVVSYNPTEPPLPTISFSPAASAAATTVAEDLWADDVVQAARTSWPQHSQIPSTGGHNPQPHAGKYYPQRLRLGMVNQSLINGFYWVMVSSMFHTGSDQFIYHPVMMPVVTKNCFLLPSMSARLWCSAQDSTLSWWVDITIRSKKWKD